MANSQTHRSGPKIRGRRTFESAGWDGEWIESGPRGQTLAMSIVIGRRV